MPEVFSCAASAKSVTIFKEGIIVEIDPLRHAATSRNLANYGEFSLGAEEYSITKPDTPRPWRNVLFNQEYSLVIAQNGIGYSTLSNFPQPITKNDRQSGRFIYVRDNDSGEFWNATWYPSTIKLDDFRSTHRPDSTEIFSKKLDIESQIVFSVSPDKTCEKWQIEFNNKSKFKRRLSIFMFVRWDDTERLRATFHDNIILATPLNSTNENIARFITLDHAVDSFDCDEEQFIGRYGNQNEPQAIIDGKCSRSTATDKSIGVLQKNLAIGAGAKSSFNVTLGAVAIDKNTTQSQIIRSVKKLVTTPVSIETKLTDELERTLVKLNEPNWNKILNVWSKHQSLVPATFNLLLSEQFTAVINQIPHQPEFAQKKLIELLAYQFRDGSVAVSFEQTIPDTSLDSTKKLLLAVVELVRESGNPSLLSEHVKFFDSGSASILEHVIRGCGIIAEELKSNSDQSVSERCTQIQTLKEVISLLTHNGEHQLVRRLERIIEESSEKLIRIWGRNSSKFEIAEIADFVSSGVLSEKQQQLAIKKLISAINQPQTLSQSSSNLGQIISIQLISEIISALLAAKQPEEAAKLFEQVLPTTLSKNSEQYQAEPYFFPAYLYGSSEQRSGQASFELDHLVAGNLWRTISEKMIGVQPTIGGLKINPQIPRNWRQLEVSRVFRGANYHIRILNPLRVNQGVDRMSVNGLRVTGNVIRPYQAGSHFVEVVLG